MARKRASMREGPLAELFRATEAAQRAKTGEPEQPEEAAADPTAETPGAPDRRREAALEATVEHVYEFDEPEIVEEPEPAQQTLEVAAEPPPHEAAVPPPTPEPILEAVPEPPVQLRPEPAAPPPRPYEPPASRSVRSASSPQSFSASHVMANILYPLRHSREGGNPD